MTLNPSTMRLGIASILVGLVGAYGVRVMMEEEDVAEVSEAPEKHAVPYASSDLPGGRQIRRGDIAVQMLTRSEMEERGWQLNQVMMSVSDIQGRISRRPIRGGQPFLTTDVYLDGETPQMVIRQGMRAVQVRVADDRGGRRARQGDIVDVYFTSEPKPAKDGRPAIPEKTIRVAEAINVAHVDAPQVSQFQRAVGYKAVAPIFTLEVTPETAGEVTALKDYGHFALMVRAADEPAGRTEASDNYTLEGLLGIETPEPPQQPPVVSVEYWYGRQRRTKHFPVAMAPPQQAAAATPTPPPALTSPQPAAPTQDVLPDPVPARRQSAPARRQPSPSTAVPYRPDSSSGTSSAANTTSANPTTATPTAAKPDPFADDGQLGDVLP